MNSDNKVVTWSLGLAFAAIVVYIILTVFGVQMKSGALGPGSSPVSKTMSDMRSIGVALETFRIDNNAYPASTTNTLETFNFRSAPPGTPSFKAFPPSSFRTTPAPGEPPNYSMTSPVAYLTSLPNDPFVPTPSPFAYFTSGTCWLVWSPGPDGRYDINHTDYDFTSETPAADFVAKYSYDATNGTRSQGDIFRSGGNLTIPTGIL